MDLVEIKDGNINRHPWEYSRADSMLKILSQYSPDLQYADVGSGDAYFAGRMAEGLSKPVYIVDTGYATSGTRGKLIQLTDIKDLPESSLDIVLLMDVIEHIDDVDSFLTLLLTRLKPGGKLVITVPAHQFLFSQHDLFLKHYRRYSRNLMRETMQKQGLIIDKMFYYYISLLFARSLMVLIEKLTNPPAAEGVGNWNYPADNIITRLVRNMLNFDFYLARFFSNFHLYLPGISICTICTKKS